MFQNWHANFKDLTLIFEEIEDSINVQGLLFSNQTSIAINTISIALFLSPHASLSFAVVSLFSDQQKRDMPE